MSVGGILQARQVTRFFAPVMTSTGRIAYKSYGSKRSAARAVARQLILDDIFGPKVEHSLQDDRDNEVCWYARTVPHEKDARIVLIAKRFPLEMCPEGYDPICRGGSEACCNCESYGYSKCAYRAEIDRIVRLVLGGCTAEDLEPKGVVDDDRR